MPGSVVREQLDGTIKKTNVVGTVSKKVTLVGSISFKTEVTAPSYSGEYEVTPKAYESQVLETKNKIMGNDVTVLEIPIARVDNTFNGITVSIG